MGLLDSLSGGGDPGAGLLSFLSSLGQAPQTGLLPSDTAQYGNLPAPQAPVFANAQPSPLDNAQYPSGPIGAPSQANAQMIPQQPPSVIQAQPIAPAMPQTAPQASAPGVGDRLVAGFQGIANSGGLLPAIANGLGGLLTGQRMDPQGIALQQQAQMQNLTARALVAKGVDPQIAMAAVAPGNAEFLKTLLGQTFGPQTVQPLGEGYIADKNGNIKRAYEPEDKNKIVQIGEDGLGQKQFGVFNPSDGSIKPIGPQGGAVQGLGDTSKSGQEYLATLPKDKQGIVQGMIDGTIQPPSSFALAKPYWQGMLAAAKNVDPSFDANTWTTRHKMSADIAASGNSSMGGILANGKSAFAHLSDLSASMADLGNASHDYPGGGAVAAAQNYLGNSTFAGSDTKAKIKAINDNLGHYGQESTKFYSGTGGGVEERMNALKEMNPTTTSSEEMAAYLIKEKSLMTDRLKQKEAQIRDTMGDAYLQKHPIFTPDLQKTLDTIDGNIAKLKGGTPAPAAPASGAAATGDGAIAHNPKTGETLIRKGGKWVPFT